METPIFDYSKKTTTESEENIEDERKAEHRNFGFKEIMKELLLSLSKFLELLYNHYEGMTEEERKQKKEEREKRIYHTLRWIYDTSPKWKKIAVFIVFLWSLIGILHDSIGDFPFSKLVEAYLNHTEEWFPAVLLLLATLFGSILFALGCSFLCSLCCEAALIAIKSKMMEYELEYAQNEAEEDLFQNSIKTSYKYLDRYYDQTQKQAQQGFRITVFIAVFGALLIFSGVAAMYAGFVQPAYITCASGAITELISAIFFYLYNKTVTSMSRYHNKLVLSQNISFALRVADSLSEEKKDDAKLAIINELVKDVNAQMMKSDNAAADAPPKKDKPSDNETPS